MGPGPCVNLAVEWRQHSTLSEYGHIVYQIKVNGACSDMKAKHFFSESSHVAYQIKGNGV